MSIFADFLTSWILPSKPPQSRRSKIIQKSSLLTLGALGFAFFSGTVFSIKTVHGVFQVLANFREKMIKNQPFFEAKKEEAAVAPRGVSNSIPSRSKALVATAKARLLPVYGDHKGLTRFRKPSEAKKPGYTGLKPICARAPLALPRPHRS